MNVLIPFEKFDINYIYYLDSVKNNIIDNSNFIRVIYSNELFMLNGIYIQINLIIIGIDKHFNKYKYLFDVEKNKNEILRICSIEKEILDKFYLSFKTTIGLKKPVYKIAEQVNSSSIKLFTEINNINMLYILKISGIWENDVEYGITYKFIDSM
jgi:hypothetical protein